MMLAPKHSSILIHETLFKVPVLGRYLQRAGHVPVVPGNGQAAFEEAKRLLVLAQQDVNERWRMYEQLALLDHST